MNLISAAKRNLPGNADINIMIFTGLGGGTGSGTFLDVCYIVYQALADMGLYEQANVYGFFFLPDVNIDKVNVDALRTHIRLNGFAAMKELDHCMNFEKNGDEWNQQYNGFSVKTSVPPVKLAHLVTATFADGSTRIDGYDYSMQTIADYVMGVLANGNIPEDFNLKSHIVRVKDMIRFAEKKNGECCDYCVVGASKYYIPYKKINTYLVSKMLESLKDADKMLIGNNDFLWIGALPSPSSATILVYRINGVVSLSECKDYSACYEEYRKNMDKDCRIYRNLNIV